MLAIANQQTMLLVEQLEKWKKGGPFLKREHYGSHLKKREQYGPHLKKGAIWTPLKEAIREPFKN